MNWNAMKSCFIVGNIFKIIRRKFSLEFKKTWFSSRDKTFGSCEHDPFIKQAN